MTPFSHELEIYGLLMAVHELGLGDPCQFYNNDAKDKDNNVVCVRTTTELAVRSIDHVTLRDLTDTVWPC